MSLRILLLLVLLHTFDWNQAVPYQTVHQSNRINPVDSLTVEQLVRDVFVKGSCVNVSNIRRLGAQAGIGYFDNGSKTIGIERGIIISSGNIEDARGPNASSQTSGQLNTFVPSQDLAKIATGQLFDISGIEFSFSSHKEFVSFRYVFASEEYCEYVNSVFNDVFGFFVSGPGIEGDFENNGIQVALVPDTEEFVSINTVNHIRNTNYYVKNETEEDTEDCNIAFDPQHPQDIEFDGFTRVLTAAFKVIPCQQYRIRLLVGDVSDAILDSAVFLEAKSFDIGPEIEMEFITDNPGSNILYEQCSEGRLVFWRTNEKDRTRQLDVDFFIDPGLSTAVAGVDYEAIPVEITIPPLTDSVSIPIRVLEDDLPEADEQLVVQLNYPCNCLTPDRVEITLSDLQPLQAQPLLNEACLGQSAGIRAGFSGGVPPYSFLWDDGSTNVERTIAQVNGPDVYGVTVTDKCGASLSSLLEIDIKEPPSAFIEGTFSWCQGQNPVIPVYLEGMPPWSIEYEFNGRVYQVDSIQTTPYLLKAEAPGLIRLRSFQDQNCQGDVFGEAQIIADSIELNYTVQQPECPGSADGAVQLAITSSTAFTVEWRSPVNDPLQPTGLAPGTYSLNVSNIAGCELEATILVREPSLEEALAGDCASGPLSAQIYAPNAFSPNQDGNNDQFRIFLDPRSVLVIREFQIFDRWGTLLYRQNRSATGSDQFQWDGTYLGQPVSSGVYLYSVTVESFDGRKQQLSGSVTLLR